MGEVSPTTNQAQAQRWNGASGQHWIEHRERHLAEHQNLTPHLFRSAAIARGERVLDVGAGAAIRRSGRHRQRAEPGTRSGWTCRLRCWRWPGAWPRGQAQ